MTTQDQKDVLVETSPESALKNTGSSKQLVELMRDSDPPPPPPAAVVEPPETSLPHPAVDTESFHVWPPIHSALWWRVTQRFLGILGCLILAPLLPFVFLAVKLTSPGPFLFKQRRRGQGGKVFTIYKIRTLRADAEQRTRLGVSKGSSVVTPVGNVLRTLKLDELPQLWNIVTGEMELVGPRPIPVALEDELRGLILNFHERNRVKPGLTAFSQILVTDNATGDGLREDWSERFQAELHYIRNKSVTYDVIVCLMSAAYVMRSFLGLVGKKSESADGEPIAELPAKPSTATKVLGSPICNLDYEGVVDRIAGWVERRERRFVGICPVHSVVESVLDADHRATLASADLNTPDGMPVVWGQKLLGFKDASRVYGPTLMLHLLQTALEKGWRVAFYGGAPDRLAKLVENVTQQYPGLRITAAISPPYRALTAEEDRDYAEQLNEANPDLVFVGLGCPKQERWMASRVGHFPGVMLGVGAAFDFHAKMLRQAPAILQKTGFEWLFRLLCEPRRLFKRYATTNPIYLALLGTEAVQRRLFRKRYEVHLQDGALARTPVATGAKVAVCLATYRRPELLRKTLESLGAQHLPDGVQVELEVRIVDNDAQGSARDVVESCRTVLKNWNVRYEIETERSISKARNRALDMGSADWVAFIDDDESADPTWLHRLLERAHQTDADVTVGAVRPVLNAEFPDWARRGGWFHKLPPTTETPIAAAEARTSNALVRGSWFYEANLRFDDAFGRSGAEDTELFSRIGARGARVHSAPSAMVRETIHAEQLRLGWLMNRFHRNGMNYERVARPLGDGSHPLLRFGKRCVRATPGLVFGSLLMVFGRRNMCWRSLTQFSRAFGGLRAWLRPKQLHGQAGYESAGQSGAGS